MIRLALICLVLFAPVCTFSGCTNASGSKLDDKPAPVAAPAPPPPKNHICERFAKVNKQATCEPHYTDVGEAHVHTATITLGDQQVHCRYDIGARGIECASPISIRLDLPPPVQDAAPKAKAKAKK